MRKFMIVCILCLVAHNLIAAEQVPTPATVHGRVHVGTTFTVSHMGEDIHLSYETNDARLGSNSGNQYIDQADYKSRDAQMNYGANVEVQKNKHLVGVEIEGKHDWKQSYGTRTESVYDPLGTELSHVNGTYNHPKDRMNDVLVGLRYSYSLPRLGDSIRVGYRYHWDNTCLGLDQQVNERSGWALYSTNMLNQQISKQTHRAWVDYRCRIAKGHVMDIGIAYDRRQLDGSTQQTWDQISHLNSDYRHLIQYGAVYAKYQMAVGPVKASVGLEYRANKIQQQWKHDVVPTVMVRYQIDSIHALIGGYRMLIIRPEYSQLDTTKLRDAFTLSFGNDALIGVHVHNTNIMYQMTLPKVVFSADLRYITTNDGLNALWIEKNNVRTYTWGNEGTRHAVSLTPKAIGQLGGTTRLMLSATVLWDERIAKAISMSNANWGISTQIHLEQRLPYAMMIAIYGDYAYHNTLNLYSYAGHGGQVGVNWNMSFLERHNLKLKVGYTCRFTPNIYITQGAYTGQQTYLPYCTHLAQIQIGYLF